MDYSLNKKISSLEMKIKNLEDKIADLTKNKGETPPIPNSKVGNMKRKNWYFLRGKWCTYAIYSD